MIVMYYQHLLVASHGTPGARAAEQLALCLAAPGARLQHLYVVPAFWRGMMGDDWLNNAHTRDAYGHYVENMLQSEAEADVRRLHEAARAAGLQYHPVVRLGDPAEALLAVLKDYPADLLLVGAPRPKGVEGLRSRLDLESVQRVLPCPLMIAPYPRE